MELKLVLDLNHLFIFLLLIVPYGIEIFVW